MISGLYFNYQTTVNPCFPFFKAMERQKQVKFTGNHQEFFPSCHIRLSAVSEHEAATHFENKEGI